MKCWAKIHAYMGMGVHLELLLMGLANQDLLIGLAYAPQVLVA